MNKVILVGNLTRDPELITTNNGISVCRFGIACQRRFANQNGEREADFINIVAWRSTADFCYKYFKKGNKVALVGSLQSRSYDAQDGSKRTVTEVVVDEVEFASSKGPSNSEDSVMLEEESGSKSTGKNDVVNKFEPIDDDNLPF